MNFNFNLKTFTNWIMEFIAGKVKSTANNISETVTGFAGFLKALGISSPHLDSAEKLAPTVVAKVDELSAEAKKLAPDLVAKAAEAANLNATRLAGGNPAANAPSQNLPNGKTSAGASTERAPAQ